MLSERYRGIIHSVSATITTWHCDPGKKLTSKLLYLSTEDWAFCQHFLVMARAAIAAGFDVAVATKICEHGSRIVEEGLRLIPLETERGSLRAFEAVSGVVKMVKIIRREKPDIVHCVGLRMVLLGGCAARIARARKIVLAPTGLGHLWISDHFFERAIRILVRFVISWILTGREVHFLFENREDPAEFGIDPNASWVTIIGGVGVAAEDFPLVPEPSDPSDPSIRVAVVSRMLVPKGIAETVAAVQLARANGADITLDLIGVPDPSNPTSIAVSDLLKWSKQEGIYWHRRVESIAKVWKEHHIAILLSYREGLPVSLVEAAASGRPIITTDVVGCREVVRDGVEGFLVPKGDAIQAAERLVQLVRDPELRRRMGQAANRRFQERFTAQIVAKTMTSLYLGLC
jgi:glycosyltransferase involved in cell wall biosynthesis